jgi:hypothetical protein
MAKSAAKIPAPKRSVVPDRLDLRDRVYQPAVAVVPKAKLPDSEFTIRIRNQGDTNACTGFALAAVVDFLLTKAKRTDAIGVSPFMLYSMARRYDEFPGNEDNDGGSSVRGGMKGWYKHGACSDRLWTTKLELPPPNAKAKHDWWQDAALRPLGAYYRVDARSVSEMHVALCETGVLYASAACHDGWNRGFGAGKTKGTWVIPAQVAKEADGGHAFALVGYTEAGFLVLNSWGTGWGTGGFGILTYEDWLDNGMDCWVAQLGVVTQHELEVSQATTLRVDGANRVRVARDANLRNHELAPFIIDLENNGELSNSGDFRTQESDLDALLNIHLVEAAKRWRPNDGVVDVAIYAHGGLTGEKAAAETAAVWIPELYSNRIFPVFVMWETDLWSTIHDRLLDMVRGQPRPTAGLGDIMQPWWNQRIERLVAKPGRWLWDEMKDNARMMAANKTGGVRMLCDRAVRAGLFKPKADLRIRLHFVGHSAGGIALSHLADALLRAEPKLQIETINFMAPAVRVDVFTKLVVPHLRSGRVGTYNQLHLTETMEQRDGTCRPVLMYGRSLLYLVAQAFEDVPGTPILGMEKSWRKLATTFGGLPAHAWASPSDVASATTHGGFGDAGDKTIGTIIGLIHGRQP